MDHSYVFFAIKYFMYLFIYLFIYLYSCSNIVVSISSPHAPQPHPSLPSTLEPTPFGFVHGSFIPVPWLPCPCYPLYPSPLSPLVIVSLFFTSMSLVVFCLLAYFVDYISRIGEMIWHLSFTTWLISLSIMLSGSIHAVAKGRSSFFLSAA